MTCDGDPRDAKFPVSTGAIGRGAVEGWRSAGGHEGSFPAHLAAASGVGLRGSSGSAHAHAHAALHRQSTVTAAAAVGQRRTATGATLMCKGPRRGRWVTHVSARTAVFKVGRSQSLAGLSPVFHLHLLPTSRIQRNIRPLLRTLSPAAKRLSFSRSFAFNFLFSATLLCSNHAPSRSRPPALRGAAPYCHPLSLAPRGVARLRPTHRARYSYSASAARRCSA